MKPAQPEKGSPQILQSIAKTPVAPKQAAQKQAVQHSLFGIEAEPPCTIAQAMSALVKCVRMRAEYDAIYWFLHISHYFPADRQRLFLRLLIICAEDCVDLATQHTAKDWYALAKIGSSNKVLRYGVSLITEVCCTENWWQNKTQQKYVQAWYEVSTLEQDSEVVVAEQWAGSMGAAKIICATALVQTPEARKAALNQHRTFIELGLSREIYAETLMQAARDSGNEAALQTARIARQFHKELGRLDDNWLGQALWRLTGMDLQAEDLRYYPLDAQLHYTRCLDEILTAPRTPEEWTQDGIHCKGSDTRFAGALSSMVACCNVYNESGYLHPLQSFEPRHFDPQTLPKEIGNAFQN